jgi:16S rRNA (uracil1498-N3)-methyltransferase
MSVPRFFIPSKAIDRQHGRVFHNDHLLVRQLTKVLRLKPGSAVDFLDGTGNLYHCRIANLDKTTVTGSIESISPPEDGMNLKVTVALPPLKSERFEWALEKLTELGVERIVPIIVERSVVKPQAGQSSFKKDPVLRKANGQKQTFDSPGEQSTKLTRWRSIIKEAAEQSERTLLPQLVPSLPFADFLRAEQETRPQSVRFICAERSAGNPLQEVLCNRIRIGSHAVEEITIAIGAEGGFTADELRAAQEAGFLPVSLGKQILRAETAAIYALAIVASHQSETS